MGGEAVKKSRFTEGQIAFALKQAETGSEHPVRAALRRGVLRAENSAYGQSYARCLREA
jgi:hypothetical protein